MSDTSLSEFEHHRINLLLPWWVNGTLDRRDHQFVEEHLGTCLICQEECEVLRRCLDSEVKEPLSTPDVNDAFAMVMQRIDSVSDVTEMPEFPVADTGSANKRSVWSVSRLAGGLSVAAAAVLLFGVMIIMRSAPETTVGEGEYSVLSSTIPSADDLYLEVHFLDDLSAQDGVAQLQNSLENPDMIVGWEKTDATTYLFRIAASASPETLSKVLTRLGASDTVTKATVVLH